MSGSLLSPLEVLRPGEARNSDDNRFKLAYQTDGNLVIHLLVPPHGALWSSHTSSTLPGHCIMQSDGNLVVYDANHRVVWASNTSGHTGASARLQTDGNLVIRSATRPPTVLWASGSVYVEPPRTHELIDGYLAIELPANSQAVAGSVAAIPAGRQGIVIWCYGPNPVYYHTEGNPPFFGDNDSGEIAVNQRTQFQITAALAFQPTVFVQAKFGATRVLVWRGPVELIGSIGLPLPQAVVEQLNSIFH